MKTFFEDGIKSIILNSAVDLLLDKWPVQFNMASIARQAGISKPRLAYHFQDTEQILTEIMRAWAMSGQFVTEATLAKNMGQSSEQLIESILDATFLWLKQYPKFAKLSPILIHLAHVYPQVGEMQSMVMSVGLKRIENILSNTVFLKKISQEKLASKAKGIHLLIVGGFLYQLATKGEKVDQKSLERIKESIQILIHQ